MSIVLLLVPAAVLILLFVGSLGAFKSRRDAALAAGTGFGVLVVAVTETLSLVRSFATVPVAILWSLAGVGAVVAVRLTCSNRSRLAKDRPAIGFDWFVGCCLIGIGVIVVPTLVVVLRAAPNNWDSMTYHLAKVANWIQHGTVAFYPTHIQRQLVLAPFAEYAVANLILLSRTDQSANLVQYSAMIGSVIAASSVARRLGAGPRGQAMAAVFVATLPMGVLQSSSTQTDFVASFWLVTLINFGLATLFESDAGDLVPWAPALCCAAAVGLAILTKATTMLFAGPFVLWIIFASVRRFNLRKAFCVAAAGAAVVIAVNAGYATRMMAAYGSPLGPASETSQYKNETHAPNAVALNILRNLATNLGLPHEPKFVTPVIIRAISGITRLNIVDPRVTWPGCEFAVKFTLNEDGAGNPVGLLLSGFAAVAVLRRPRSDPTMTGYLACAAAGLFAFCYELKWQGWGNRLELPLFVAIGPLVGTVLGRMKSVRLPCAAVVVMVLAAFPFAVENQTRAILGPYSIFRRPRADQYFAARPDLCVPYEQAAAVVRATGIKRVGLFSDLDGWEYAVRTLSPGVDFESVGVTNKSRSFEPFHPAGLPDLIVILDRFGIADGPWPADDYVVIFDDPSIKIICRRGRKTS